MNLVQELDVWRASKINGLSRDTFYRYQTAIEAGGVEELVEKSRRKPSQKNRTDCVARPLRRTIRWASARKQ